ncbi:hypothetical protein [Cellulomonas sp. 73-145]|uniref:hypothetical protein n=1 Tax=Cellulomonas sp. 73-145 TaxID=1895739 RepID=UPI0025C37570|nr:hypothetical protein [Cellulomonas sp. 73-145]
MAGLEVWFMAAVAGACAGTWVWIDDRAELRQARRAHRFLDLADWARDGGLEADLQVLARMHVALLVRTHRRPHRVVGLIVAIGLTGFVLAAPLWWHLHPEALVGWVGGLWAVVVLVLAVEAPAAWGYVASLTREPAVADEDL